MINNSVILFLILASGSGDLKDFLSGALVVEPNHLCNFERGHKGEH